MLSNRRIRIWGEIPPSDLSAMPTEPRSGAEDNAPPRAKTSFTSWSRSNAVTDFADDRLTDQVASKVRSGFKRML